MDLPWTFNGHVSVMLRFMPRSLVASCPPVDHTPPSSSPLLVHLIIKNSTSFFRETEKKKWSFFYRESSGSGTVPIRQCQSVARHCVRRSSVHAVPTRASALSQTSIPPSRRGNVPVSSRLQFRVSI